MVRYEYVDVSIRESDIHPDSIAKEERKLAKFVVENIPTSNEVSLCPVCHFKRDEILFEKWGQQYLLCPETWSLALASLPDEDLLYEYYHTSDLANFRASKEYQTKVSNMRKGLWDSQLEWIEGRVRRYIGMGQYIAFDWGSKFVGWAELLNGANFISECHIVEPLPPVLENDLGEEADLICLMDVIQRKSNPQKLLRDVNQRLRPGGILVVTCRSGSGFDILTLRERSESVFPLDHICLPSPKGMQLMLEKAGFKVLELATPGLLDVQLVKNISENIPKDQYFQRYLMDHDNELFFERLQAFLQQNNLSSHIRAVAQKVGVGE